MTWIVALPLVVLLFGAFLVWDKLRNEREWLGLVLWTELKYGVWYR